MTIYMSGGGNCEELAMELGIGMLYSFLLDEGLLRNAVAKGWRPLMVDSGAFSWNQGRLSNVFGQLKTNLPDVSTYHKQYIAALLKEHTIAEIWVELDAYAVLSVAEVDAAWHEVKKHSGIRDKYVRVYHPILDGGSMDTVRKWIDDGVKYIGVARDCKPFLDQFFAVAAGKVRVHGFTFTSPQEVLRYPFWSCDSTNHMIPQRFGGVPARFFQCTGRQDAVDERSWLLAMTSKQKRIQSLHNAAELQRIATDSWARRSVVPTPGAQEGQGAIQATNSSPAMLPPADHVGKAATGGKGRKRAKTAQGARSHPAPMPTPADGAQRASKDTP